MHWQYYALTVLCIDSTMHWQYYALTVLCINSTMHWQYYTLTVLCIDSTIHWQYYALTVLCIDSTMHWQYYALTLQPLKQLGQWVTVFSPRTLGFSLRAVREQPEGTLALDTRFNTKLQFLPLLQLHHCSTLIHVIIRSISCRHIKAPNFQRHNLIPGRK